MFDLVKDKACCDYLIGKKVVVLGWEEMIFDESASYFDDRNIYCSEVFAVLKKVRVSYSSPFKVLLCEKLQKVISYDSTVHSAIKYVEDCDNYKLKKLITNASDHYFNP